MTLSQSVIGWNPECRLTKGNSEINWVYYEQKKNKRSFTASNTTHKTQGRSWGDKYKEAWGTQGGLNLWHENHSCTNGEWRQTDQLSKAGLMKKQRHLNMATGECGWGRPSDWGTESRTEEKLNDDKLEDKWDKGNQSKHKNYQI